MKLAKFSGVYIPSVDAKDIYIAQGSYTLYARDGSLNTRRFVNTLDYSLELIKLRECSKRIHRNLSKFSTFVNEKEYSSAVVNVTFSYSNKEWNKYCRGDEVKYVKFGHTCADSDFNDSICLVDGEIVGVVVDKYVEFPVPDVLPKNFAYDDENSCYRQVKTIAVLNDVASLRKELYDNGFYIDGRRYVRFKRSSGSSRIGKCLFILEELYNWMHMWELCGLSIKENDNIDLAAFESYISLTLSSIVDTIAIGKKNILVIDDYSSVFNANVVVTKDINGVLATGVENAVVENSIWDGQSLVDSSLFDKSMMLLRNRFFKSACFSTNLKQWFEDNGITDVSQLNGFTLAEKIEDIKMITTPNSIKYLKFGTLEQWFDNLDENFGIVKYDKPTKCFGGDVVRIHYQLLNSLDLSYDEVNEVAKDSLQYVNMLKCSSAVVRHRLKYECTPSVRRGEISSTNDMVFKLLNLNEKFYNTEMCRLFINNIVMSECNEFRCGHLMVNGTYSTLFGNPLEMLKQSIGIFDGSSSITPNTVHTTFYIDGTDVVCSRSPHISFSNVLNTTVRHCDDVSKYFNLSNEIICVNSIDENILNRCSGADFDSDTILVTNNEVLVNAGKRNTSKFLVPIDEVCANKISRKYNNIEKCDLDIKTSVNLIGEIINLAGELNSLYIHRLHNGCVHSDNDDIYLDICKLDIMSRIEIDSAKKEFSINNKTELSLLRDKYRSRQAKIGGKPMFFKGISKIKGYDTSGKNYTNYDIPMDYLCDIISKYKFKRFVGKGLRLKDVIDVSLYRRDPVHGNSACNIMDIVMKSKEERKIIFSNGNLDKFQKHILYNESIENVVKAIKSRKISKNTMTKIIMMADNSENKRQFREAIKIIMMAGHDTLYDIFDDNIEYKREFIYDEMGNISMFGYTFDIV